MGPEVIELLAPVLVFLGLGSFVLIGMKMRYSHVQRTRQPTISQKEVEQLTDAVHTLHDEVRLLRDEHLALNERLEFTERLLERPRGAKAESDPS